MELIYAEDSGLLLRCIIRSDNNGSKPPVGHRYGLGESSRRTTAQLPGTPPPLDGIRATLEFAGRTRSDFLNLDVAGGLPSPTAPANVGEAIPQ